MISNIKNLSIYTLVVLIFGAGSWELARRHIWTVKSKEIIVTKTETKWVVKPTDATPQMLFDWSKSPIIIDYTFLHSTSEYTEVNVFAHDLNKSTEQVIKVPVAESGNFKYYVAGGIVVAGIIGGVAAYKIFK
jgi:hypothetical protein